MKRKKSKILGSNILFIVLIIIFTFVVDILNGCGDSLAVKKKELESEVNLLHSKRVELYSRMAKYELIGYIEDVIKRKKLSFVRDTVVYIEKSVE